MVEYLIILLDDKSTSFCHYDNKCDVNKLIPLETLKAGILFAMKENLMIQFVYPDYELPAEYKIAIESIDHSKIVSSLCEDITIIEEADVIVYRNWDGLSHEKFESNRCYVLQTTKVGLFNEYVVLKEILSNVARLNIIISDVESFADQDFDKYKQVLNFFSEYLEKLYINGKAPQLNLLTDRMMLSQMNNCGAGDISITLAPNGKFYVCPAFYYEDETDCIGDLGSGLDIKNKQLYKLQYAPICRNCDAYQCKRCIWLNRKMTLEVNTPSHEQCVLAHLERNVSRDLLANIRKHGTFLPEQDEIKVIDYLDPFDKLTKTL